MIAFLNIEPRFQERLGHSGVAITMDIYSHLLPRKREEAGRKVDEAKKKDRHDDDSKVSGIPETTAGQHYRLDRGSRRSALWLDYFHDWAMWQTELGLCALLGLPAAVVVPRRASSD